jgi:hypothetical protein
MALSEIKNAAMEALRASQHAAARLYNLVPVSLPGLGPEAELGSICMDSDLVYSISVFRMEHDKTHVDKVLSWTTPTGSSVKVEVYGGGWMWSQDSSHNNIPQRRCRFCLGPR